MRFDIEKMSYLETDLPQYLMRSIQQFKRGLEKHNQNIGYMEFDMDWDELNSDINVAEVDGDITSNQAWYLREKYLGISQDDL